MNLLTKLIDDPIDRYFSKYRHKYDRLRTQLEQENYWAAAVRNIAPITLKEHKSGKYIIINNKLLARTIIVGIPTDSENGYPKEMDDSMITRLIELSAKGNRIAYSLKLDPINTTKARGDIQTSMYVTQVNAEEKIADVQKKKHINLQDMDSQIAQKHNESNYEAVVDNVHKTMDSSFIITIWADTEAELYGIESDITLVLESTGVKFEVPDDCHMDTYLAGQPYGLEVKQSKVRIFSPYAAMIASTRNPNSITDNEGLWFGTDKVTKKDIIFDPRKIVAPHFLCVGPTGSGKTAAIFAYMMRMLPLGYRVIYITPKEDPGTNHRALVDYYGPDIAALIDIGPQGNNINPLQIIYDRFLMNDDIDEYSYAFNMHKEIFIRFMQTWFADTGTINMSTLLDPTLTELYNNAGIYKDVPSTWHDANWPVMSDLLDLLTAKKARKGLDIDLRKTINAVLNKSTSFDKDGMLGYMNHPTTVDFTKDLMVFDMSKIPPMIRPAMHLLVSAICGQRFRIDTTRDTVLVIDEARFFLKDEELAEFLIQCITLGRAVGVSLWILTQQPSDLIKSNVSEEFLTNTFIKLILGNNMLDENIDIVRDFFKFNEYITEHILSSNVGDGILVAGKQHIPMHVQLTDMELAIFNDKFNTTTNKIQEVNEPTIIPALKDFVLKHGFCLDKWATSFNLPGWKMKRVHNAIDGTGMITAWIKEDKINTDGTILNQSIDHYSTVVQIGAYILQKGITNIEINHRTDADIVFSTSMETDANFEHAIEFEIDGSHTEKQLQEKRSRLLEDYDYVYFTCHSRYEKKLGRFVGTNNVYTRGSQLKDLLDGIIG